MLGIRVSTEIAAGGGHLARCLAIRAEYDDTVTWYIDPPGREQSLNFPAGDPVIPEAAADNLDYLEADLIAGRIEGALVDCRGLEISKLSRLASGHKVAALMDGMPYPATSLVIDPQLTADPRRAHLAGPSYMALPRESHRWRGIASDRNDRRLRLLIAFGAVDSANLSLLAARCILDSPISAEIAGVTIAVGSLAPNVSSLRHLAGQYSQIDLTVRTEAIWPIYADHDLAIGAPGVSQAERACCGLPTLLVPQNHDQIALARAWAAQGAALMAQADSKEIGVAVSRLVHDRRLRHDISGKAMQLVDGLGARRIAAALVELTEKAT